MKFDSLPMALRAIAREKSDRHMIFEAELPWLAIGTGVSAESAAGVGRAGRVDSFDIEVTSSGSARLVIVADISLAGSARSAIPSRSRPPPRTVVVRWVALPVAAFVLAVGVLLAYALGRQSVQPARPTWAVTAAEPSLPEGATTTASNEPPAAPKTTSRTKIEEVPVATPEGRPSASRRVPSSPAPKRAKVKVGRRQPVTKQGR